MEIIGVNGIPPALFDNFLDLRAEEKREIIIAGLRDNSAVERYLSSLEFAHEYARAGLIRTIAEFGYERQEKVSEVGEYAIKGELLTLWPVGFLDPVRVEYFDEEIEKIVIFDLLTGRKIRELKQLPLGDINYLPEQTDKANIYVSFPDKVAEFSEQTYLLKSPLSQADEIFDFTAPALYFQRFDLLTKEIRQKEEEGYKVKIVSHNKQQLADELKPYQNTNLDNLPFGNTESLEMGVISEERKVAIYTDRELFGKIFVRARDQSKLKSSEARKLLQQLEGEIEVGDYIVHEDHGVGIYRGFLQEDGSEYLQIEYAEGDELFVPLEQLSKLTKFIGESGTSPEITRLGKGAWEKLKNSVKKQVALSAKELARHYAKLELANSIKVDQEDSEQYKDFLKEFGFEPTKDQLQAEGEIIADLGKDRPMDRLLIGDVGFGKTEVMMRASFKIMEAGHQVLVLAPTTVLAMQHSKSFGERFKNTPFNLAMLSRKNSPAENKKILQDFEQGKYDLLIGTHRLLSSDVRAKSLGLLIIDEEQRFGVKQKEKIRKLEAGVHTLSVSATPIPRTLSMALSAIKAISLIQTPPPERKAVETHVEKLNWNTVAQAISKEVERGGQVLFIHNRVATIPSVVARLQDLLPELTVSYAHGQMSVGKLEELMSDFYEGKQDVLVATTILENGLDIENANTLIVTNAQNFGLSQMHQLRGRVGRGKRQAYAYFFYKGKDLPAESELESNNKQEQEQDSDEKPTHKRNESYLDRLETILSAQSLGSGFRVASKDIEIRGAGNLLGAEQSGNISKVGYGLYMQMLAEEVERLKN
ncbi:MAG: helicase-related protein [Candidatus Dojkabacteria bacterium]